VDEYRWHVVVHYRMDSGTVEVEHDLVEVSDLHDLVERGPHWDTIERMEVFPVNHHDPSLTINQAETR
jgi:hypothetical protein